MNIKKVNWKCDKGHKWSARIIDRANGQGQCRECKLEQRSFAIICPELLPEWDYSKNTVRPEEVFATSKLEVFWKCKRCGCEWPTKVFRRTYGKSKCPDCKIISVKKGNDLESNYPELASEWDKERNTLLPSEVNKGSTRIVFWKCAKGHSWPQSVRSRVRNKNICMVCSGKYIIPEINSFGALYPNLIQEFDIDENEIDPYQLSPKSDKKVNWKCYKGHKWSARIIDRVNGQGQCRECKLDQKSFAIRCPELLPEWDYSKNKVRPEEIFATSKREVFWKCKRCGCEWPAKVFHRTYGTSKCPRCKEYIIEKGDDLESNYPEVALEWDKEKNALLPSEVGKSSERKVYWKCAKGHSWLEKVRNRAKRKTGCKICSGKIITPDLNSFAAVYPELLKEYDYENNEVDPYKVSTKNKKKVWWICSEGHRWKATFYHRAKYNTGCPMCQHTRAISGETDFATLYPELLKEWDYKRNLVNPHECGAASSINRFWICPKGHSWQTSICHRTRDKSGCPFCAGQRAIAGENDLLTVNKELAEYWDYERNAKPPTEYMEGSKNSVFWKCKNGHEWRAPIYKMVERNDYCIECGKIYGEI